MLIIKTPIGLEFQAASYLKEMGIKAIARPEGHVGLVLAFTDNSEVVEKELPEAEHVIPVIAETEAEIEKMAEKAREIGRQIRGSYGVKVTRRGKHDFTSVDVARVVGAVIKDVSGARVDLTSPRYWVFVEIINEKAYFGVLPGEKVRRKYVGKKFSPEFTKKLVIVQMPYTGSGAREMGKRVGRAAQAFEVKKLIIANVKPVEGGTFALFLRGVIEGRKSRFKVQVGAYQRDVRKTEVEVENLYMLVRQLNRKRVLLIGTDPTGDSMEEVRERIKEEMKRREEIYVLCGSREGIPKGVLRQCDFVVDLAPGITYATEHAIPAAVIGLTQLWLEMKGEH